MGTRARTKQEYKKVLRKVDKERRTIIKRGRTERLQTAAKLVFWLLNQILQQFSSVIDKQKEMLIHGQIYRIK